MAKDGEASELRGRRRLQPGHEIGAVDERDSLPAQLASEFERGPEKWTGLAVAQFCRTVGDRRESSGPEQRIDRVGLGGAERKMSEVTCVQALSYPQRGNLGARYRRPRQDVCNPRSRGRVGQVREEPSRHPLVTLAHVQSWLDVAGGQGPCRPTAAWSADVSARRP